MTTFYRFAVLSLFLAFILSCATADAGRRFDTRAHDQIVIGQTTEADVLGLLGSPLKTKVNPDGTKLYGYGHVTARASAVPFAARSRLSGDKLLIYFDKNGVVSGMDRSTLPE